MSPRLRRLIRKLRLGLAGLVGGFAFACGSPTNPGEMPPLAPRPDPMQPMPGGPHAERPTSNKPVPGAPDPLSKPARPTKDAGEIPTGPIETRIETRTGVDVRNASYRTPPEQPMNAQPMQDIPPDGGMDALELPPVPDALPQDANKQPDRSTGFACC